MAEYSLSPSHPTRRVEDPISSSSPTRMAEYPLSPEQPTRTEYSPLTPPQITRNGEEFTCPPPTPPFPSLEVSPKPPLTSPQRPSCKEDGKKLTSREGDRSPDPNCSICLGKLENKSFTDSCFHQFCFTCLLEWSKIKAECPLCKQSFKSIIHNVRSIEDYDQYHLHPSEPEPSTWQDVNRRFRYRSTLTQERRRQLAMERLFMSHSLAHGAVIPPGQMTTRSLWHRRRQIATSDFRRQIYHQNLWVQPISDITGRYRETSSEFFRTNPACVHRLVPWLNRELNILLWNQTQPLTYVLERILDLITRYDIQSPEFREQLRPYISHHTDHFIHEFYHYARSPFDMIGYDENANYAQRLHAVEETHSISSSSDDSDVIIISPEPTQNVSETVSQNTQNTQDVASENNNSAQEVVSSTSSKDHRAHDHTYGAGASGWDSPGPSQAPGWETPPPTSEMVITTSASPTLPESSGTGLLSNLGVSECEQQSNNLAHSNLNNSDLDSDRGKKIHLSKVKTEASDSDECEIIGYVKPLHERTPTIVYLSSGEDEPVVEVEQEVENPSLGEPVEEQDIENSSLDESASSSSPKSYKRKRKAASSDSDWTPGKEKQKKRTNKEKDGKRERHRHWKKSLRKEYEKTQAGPSKRHSSSSSCSRSRSEEWNKKYKPKIDRSKFHRKSTNQSQSRSDHLSKSNHSRSQSRERSEERKHSHSRHSSGTSNSTGMNPLVRKVMNFFKDENYRFQNQNIQRADNSDSHSESNSCYSRSKEDNSYSKHSKSHKHKHRKHKHKKNKSGDHSSDSETAKHVRCKKHVKGHKNYTRIIQYFSSDSSSSD